MDERIREHAAVVVDWSARVSPGDNVVVSASEGAHDLAVAVAAELGARGANLLATYASDEVERAYLTAADGDFEADPSHEAALISETDVYVAIRAGRNTTAKADVPGAVRQAYSRARQGLRETRLATDWVLTVHPTRSLAQQAGMSFEAYQDFVYGAVLRDWEALADEMAELKALLDAGSEVRIEKERTDLTMSVEDRFAVNSAASVAYDSHNLPSGEVFTAPEATEGEVFFDVPMTINDRRVRDAWLSFEDGEVVDYGAETGAESIEETLETDDGARRLGELGVGMNRGIDRPTGDILFDEKMGGTVHLALGRAYADCLPEGEPGNQSAVHVDLITDMTGDSTLRIDGEVVQRDGTFRWEDGFEG